MIETEIMIIVPKSFKNGIVLSLENSGHETVDGRKGDVLVNINCIIPYGWVLLEESYQILFNRLLSFEDLLKVKEFEIISPLGDSLAIKMPKIDFQLSHLLVGFNITMKGYGLLTGERSETEIDLIDLDDENQSNGDQQVQEDLRGDLIVHCDVDWNSITKDTFQDLLLVKISLL
jgi:DnaJ-class molecular chaperone